MKRTYSIELRGKRKLWGFHIKGTPEHAEAWRADGLEVWEVLNTVPLWAQQIGLTRLWCRVQDGWQWLRVW